MVVARPALPLFRDARAVTPVSAIALDGSCLRGKCETDAELGYQLLKRVTTVMNQRLQSTRVRLLDLYGTDSVRAPRRATRRLQSTATSLSVICIFNRIRKGLVTRYGERNVWPAFFRKVKTARIRASDERFSVRLCPHSHEKNCAR